MLGVTTTVSSFCSQCCRTVPPIVWHVVSSVPAILQRIAPNLVRGVAFDNAHRTAKLNQGVCGVSSRAADKHMPLFQMSKMQGGIPATLIFALPVMFVFASIVTYVVIYNCMSCLF